MGKYKDDSAVLSFLYCTAFGRILLKIIAAPAISKVAGAYLNSRLSKRRIRRFVKKNDVDLSLCESTEFSCFNDFFVRKLKPEVRPVDLRPDALIAPCDGLLSVYNLTADARFAIKGRTYSVDELLRGCQDTKRFENGQCLVFRLCVNDYHRYHYMDDGVKTENRFIKGKLHTVRPIALGAVPVFHENSREYTLLDTKNFGTVAQIEVGAMLVGKILNHHGEHQFKRGEEKGMFLFGGSTVVLLLEPNRAQLLPEFAADGEERKVCYGQQIGFAVH